MKRNRPQLISGSLYVETLRQLRLMGLIYLACCLVFSILPAFLDSVQGGFGAIPTIESFSPLLFVYVYVAPLTLACSAFGYLTRRNASDFYHSLPLTRECMFLSRVLAVLTYLLGTIVLSLLGAYLTHLVCGRALNWSYLPDQLGYFCACALLVLGGSLIGLTATGTYFSAFIVTGLVLFLPQFISLTTSVIIEEAGRILCGNDAGLLFNATLNLPASAMAYLLSMGFVGDFTPEESMRYAAGIAYTVALGAIYIAAALLLYRVRKSETAQKSAPNRVLQHIYRCAFSLPLFLVLGMMLVMDWGVFWNEPSFTFVLLAAALLVYFIYELVTTRRLRNLLPALYVLPLVLAVSVGVPYLGKVIGRNAMHTVPAPEEVASLNLDVPLYSGTNDYTELQLSRVEYADESLIGLMTDSLADTVALLDREDSRSGYSILPVRFNLRSGRSLTRLVYLTPERDALMQAHRDGYTAYREALTRLPGDEEILSIRAPYRAAEDPSSAAGAERALWETFRAEYDLLTDEQQRSLLRSGAAASVSSNNALGSGVYLNKCQLSVTGVSGANSFCTAYAITPLTPQTLLKVMRDVNASAHAVETMGALAEAEAALRTVRGDVEAWAYCGLSIYDPTHALDGSVEFSPSLTEALPAEKYVGPADTLHTAQEMIDLIALLREGSTDIPSLDAPIVLLDHLSVDVYGESGFGTSANQLFLRLTPEQLEQLGRLLSAYVQPSSAE